MVVGLTGGLAAGKSAVADFFQELGARLIDADMIAHQLASKGTDAYNEIVRTFGKKILCDDGSINRARLADLIFKDKGLRKKLNGITHPRIRLEIEHEIKQFHNLKSKIGNPKILIIDAPLLIEAGMRDLVDRLIVVKLDGEQQIRRLMKRENLSQKEAMERISTQLPLNAKLALADYVVDNNGLPEETKVQAEKIYKELIRT